MASSSSPQESFPSLPTLYFKDRCSLPVLTAASSNNNNVDDDVPLLPAELTHSILVEYSTWGDLAKLACVQRQWQTLVADAAQESQQAMWDLAQALLHGHSGLQTNPELAMKYLLQLSNMQIDVETGFPTVATTTHNNNNNNKPFAPAMREIATNYLLGHGVAHDSAQGVAWLKASHVHGQDVDAAYELAQILEHGRHGVDIDVYDAFAWFEKAAQSGHVEAMAELALCYELGCGVEQSDEKALEWYRKAALEGHGTAKYSVGEFFEEARGVPQSDEEAALWYYKAALDGDEDGQVALRRLEDIARIVVPGAGRLLDG